MAEGFVFLTRVSHSLSVAVLPMYFSVPPVPSPTSNLQPINVFETLIIQTKVQEASKLRM